MQRRSRDLYLKIKVRFFWSVKPLQWRTHRHISVCNAFLHVWYPISDLGINLFGPHTIRNAINCRSGGCRIGYSTQLGSHTYSPLLSHPRQRQSMETKANNSCISSTRRRQLLGGEGSLFKNPPVFSPGSCRQTCGSAWRSLVVVFYDAIKASFSTEKEIIHRRQTKAIATAN